MRLPIRSLAPGLVLAGLCATATAAEGKSEATWDLRVILDNMPGYDVREDASSGGATTTYEWQGMDGGRSWQPEAELLRAQPLGSADGGSTLLYGFRFSGGSQESAPAGYFSNGVSYTNTTHETISWYRLALGAVVGWQSCPLHIQDTQLFGELSAYGEVGLMRLSVQDDTGSGSDWGRTREYGLRAGVYLAERSWYGGALVSLIEGWGEGEAETFGGTATSKFHLHRDGMAVGVVGGYRF